MTDKSNTAFLDCFSGISGDMLLGALLDAGLPEAVLREQLAGLNLDGVRLAVQERRTHGLRATRCAVVVDETEQPHRSFATIRHLLTEARLAEPVRERALKVFTLLAEAEARVHGTAIEAVHFHEVGGVDAMVDIVGAAIGFHHLGIAQVVCSPLPMPHGWVHCEHGPLPLPAPAVCELIAGMEVYGVDCDQELVTPTGAALARGLATDFGPMPAMVVDRVGYGAGQREHSCGRPNLLRLVLGRGRQVAEAQRVEVIDCHLDDWNPEGFPYLSEQLFAAGALDVALIPMQMKKGRPGFLLRVIAAEAESFVLKQLILTETSAIGLRFRSEQRLTLPRACGTVLTRWGRVGAKRIETPTGIVLTPEYEACRRLAAERDVPLRQIYAEVQGCDPETFEEQEGSRSP